MLIAKIPPYRPPSPIKRAIHSFKRDLMYITSTLALLCTIGGIFILWAVTVDLSLRRRARRLARTTAPAG